ncbi:hypothetical protein BBJ29_000812 [Phytophthora kernoviae]|uniref:Uncharacterized protein n=1 Tax=Phytophthora kernoviae TaxID=325452 RepID=A0A3F2S261_9STRA|nr:hypothetical protein BBJ29_000812 [Phytophthora kernoviae]RLN68316.1 hypothetical protein BBP00_00001108 [Phytophthora kernoviae]
MLDTAAHMQLLLQQAKIKDEHPTDRSFLPLSLSMTCLLRQLPAGLAPLAGGGLSFPQLDRLPQAELERRLASMLLEDPLCVFSFLCTIVRYVKTTRSLLTLCHDHMINRRTTEDATQSVVQAVVDALPPTDEEEEEDVHKEEDEEEDTQEQETRQVNEQVWTTTDNSRKNVAAVLQKPHAVASKGEKRPQSVVAIRATDPAGIMRRAVSRDVGDGSAVLEIMKKYPTDVRIQSHGVRALKGVIRNSVASTEHPQDFDIDDDDENSTSHEPGNSQRIGLERDDDSEDDTGTIIQSQQPDATSRTTIQMVIDKMKQFPELLTLQRDGLLSLAEYAHQAEGHIAVITSSGGIISIVDAMASLPDDVSANMAGLSVLAHPKIADETIVRVNPESRRLVLSAMERFPLNEQVQGLSCLALANLSLRQGT